MDVFALIATERHRLADALEELTPDEWEAPSLCGAWTNHQVAAHLNVPFQVSTLGFLAAMAKARGNFDVANDRLARGAAEDLDPQACIAGLRANAEHRFTPPGFGPEAPLTDVIAHGTDILTPLGRPATATPGSLAVVLPFLVEGKGAGRVAANRSKGLRVEASDPEVHVGLGDALVRGPALALAGAILGRAAFLPDLTGDGADLLAQRV